MENAGQDLGGAPWAWSDAVATWSWPGRDGEPITIAVYGDARDEVELLVNGRSLGRQPVGEGLPFRTEFDTTYEPGELLAIAYRDCTETGRPVIAANGGGSADPASEERFDATERRTYEGRALAVLRPTGPGKIRLLASAPDCEPVEVLVVAER